MGGCGVGGSKRGGGGGDENRIQASGYSDLSSRARTVSCLTSTETVYGLLGTGRPGRLPRLSHSS